MRITGFICEFNPLHDGHRYFMQKVREVSGADYLVALMSGDYVQRGEPSVLPMHERAEEALRAGADLVLELPVQYACASAQYFAEGGVKILDSLGCVDTLCFGAECADTALLSELAQFLNNSHDALQPLIRSYISSGMTYAAARTNAAVQLWEKLPSHTCKPADLRALMQAPNNQLALAYMQAAAALDSKIQPLALRRMPEYESSSAIRRRLVLQPDGRYLFPDDFSLPLKDRLMHLSAGELACCPDITPDLANRIKNRQNEFIKWSSFTDLLHTKEMTRARISRCLCHILLGIRRDDPAFNGAPEYVRVLGLRKEAGALMSHIRQSSALTLYTSLPRQVQDRAADLYESVRTDKYSIPFTECHSQPVRVI